MSAEQLRDKVEKAIQTIKPNLLTKGGDIELVEVTDGIVKVRLTLECGFCDLGGCDHLMAEEMLQQDLERMLRQKVPGVKCLIAL